MCSAGKTGRDDRQQIGAMNGDVRRTVELFAQRIERRPLQGAPVLPASLVGEEWADPLAVEPRSEAQPAQDAHCIRAHVDAAADLSKLGSLLVDVDLEAGLAQRQRSGEAADAATDHGLSSSRRLGKVRRPARSTAVAEPEPPQERGSWRR